MVLQFKRSKKLDHALKLMRESQREHHASDSSAVSGASMSDDDDEEEDDDDTIGEEIEQSSSRQERQVTPRDPEGSEGRQVFQLQKLPITEPKQGKQQSDCHCKCPQRRLTMNTCKRTCRYDINQYEKATTSIRRQQTHRHQR